MFDQSRDTITRFIAEITTLREEKLELLSENIDLVSETDDLHLNFTSIIFTRRCYQFPWTVVWPSFSDCSDIWPPKAPHKSPQIYCIVCMHLHYGSFPANTVQSRTISWCSAVTISQPPIRSCGVDTGDLVRVLCACPQCFSYNQLEHLRHKMWTASIVWEPKLHN